MFWFERMICSGNSGCQEDFRAPAPTRVLPLISQVYDPGRPIRPIDRLRGRRPEFCNTLNALQNDFRPLFLSLKRWRKLFRILHPRFLLDYRS